MLKTSLGFGLTLQGMVSSLWSLSDGQGAALSLIVGVLGLLPTVGGWARAFVYGDPNSNSVAMGPPPKREF